MYTPAAIQKILVDFGVCVDDVVDLLETLYAEAYASKEYDY